jgi:hypothetical protein
VAENGELFSPKKERVLLSVSVYQEYGLIEIVMGVWSLIKFKFQILENLLPGARLEPRCMAQILAFRNKLYLLPLRWLFLRWAQGYPSKKVVAGF